MDTETLLRKHFGLKGDFYTKEFAEFNETHKDDFDEDFDGEIWTDEANEAWERMNAFVEDLKEIGAIDEDTMNEIFETFCDFG